MNFELTEKDYCKFELNCVLSSDKVKTKKEEVLKSFANAPCPGFRKGKASKEAILTYYKSQVEESLKRALAEDAFHDAIFDKDLRPIGSPTFSSLFIKDNKFYCTFLVDVRPTFELKDVKEIVVPKPSQSLTIEDLTNQKLEELRNRFGDVKFFTVDDFVQDGDSLIVSYTSTLEDGTVVEQLTSESEVIEVGKSVDKDFSDNLLGMKLNETRDFPYKVKSNLPSLTDKTVNVKVTLSNATKVTPCSLDNTLAEKVGKSNYDDLVNYVKTISAGILENKLKADLAQSISNTLVETHSFKVQDWLVKKESMYLTKSAKLNYESLSDEDKAHWDRVAEKNVKLSFVLDKVREVHPEAQLSDQEVLAHLKRALSGQLKDDSNESLAAYLAKMGHYSQVLFAKIRDEFALGFVAKNVKVVE